MVRIIERATGCISKAQQIYYKQGNVVMKWRWLPGQGVLARPWTWVRWRNFIPFNMRTAATCLKDSLYGGKNPRTGKRFLMEINTESCREPIPFSLSALRGLRRITLPGRGKISAGQSKSSIMSTIICVKADCSMIRKRIFIREWRHRCRTAWRQHHSAPCRISLVDITEKSDYPFR